jgi:hypothetical protein
VASRNRLRRALFERLEGPLHDAGFSWVRTKDSFVRKRAASSDRFQLSFFSNGSRVQADVGVRFDGVEQIFHTSSNVTPKYIGESSTVGRSIGSILHGSAQGFELPLVGDRTFERLVNAFIDVALPYYAAFSSLAAIDHELNTEPLVPSPNRRSPWLRGSTGLIVARLVGRVNYRQLVDAYRGVIERVDAFHLRDYDALVTRLESIEPQSDSAAL